MTKTALITGVTGQDGAYLAEFLLSKGYAVHGIKRRSSLFNTDRIDHLYSDPHEQNFNFSLHYGDMTDSSSLIRTIAQIEPDDVSALRRNLGEIEICLYAYRRILSYVCCDYRRFAARGKHGHRMPAMCATAAWVPR